MNRCAVITLSNAGLEVAKIVAGKRRSVDIYLSNAVDTKITKCFRFEKILPLVRSIFNQYDSIVFIMASGIAVRSISRFIKNKNNDPAVIVIDEKGRFVISLLSGHIGGANRLAEDISKKLKGSVPVITTSSDVNKLPSLDLLFDKIGWCAETPKRLSKVSHALINKKSVYIFDETGILKRHLKGIDNIIYINHIPKRFTGRGRDNNTYYIIVSDKGSLSAITEKFVLIVRPKDIVLGVGCRRGISSTEFEDKILTFLEEIDISIRSVREIATINIKRDEAAISDFSLKYNIPVRYFSKDEINKADTISPSSKVKRLIGVYGVCEPVIELCKAKIFIKKTNLGDMTIAAGKGETLFINCRKYHT